MAKRRREQRADRIAAFEAVVAHYEAALLRYATRILRNTDTAQDVVQDTFIRLYRKWKDVFEPSTQMSNWLYRVTHNCAVDHIRREARRQNTHLQHAEESECMAPPAPGPGGARISAAAHEAARALSALDLREQQLVILKVFEEKSYREISEIADLTVSNVGYILHHAMKKLAAAMKKAKQS